MKIRIRSTPTDSVDSFHANKKGKFLIRVRQRSGAIRKHQLRDAQTARETSVKQAHEANGNGTVNGSGNKRGLHRQDVSPDQLSNEMKVRRAMRKFYSKAMPVPQCNGCAFANSCPQFRAGYECAFLPFLNSHKIESVEDLIEYMKQMVESGARRTMWALTAETLTGGAPSFETTEQMQMLFGQLKDLYELVTKQDTDIEIEGDSGILGQIFGGLGNLLQETREAKAKPIDINPLIKDRGEAVPLLTNGNTPADVRTDFIQEFAKEEILRKQSAKREHTGTPVIEVSEAK